MTPIESAIRQAFESVYGPRPTSETHGGTNLAVYQAIWDTELQARIKFLRALEQHGYKVVPMEPTKEMLQAGLIFEGEYRSAIDASPEMPT